ncbi:MAG: hypothetical protein C4531_10600 [Desulfurivibrio sp.]|nr:MAG: hypothetical protein C4531_10600 [Desulfurivibrio sp.]
MILTRQRQRSGRRYGKERDDARRSCIRIFVPNGQLSETEKRMDVESAKAIVAELIRLGILRQ